MPLSEYKECKIRIALGGSASSQQVESRRSVPALVVEPDKDDSLWGKYVRRPLSPDEYQQHVERLCRRLGLEG